MNHLFKIRVCVSVIKGTQKKSISSRLRFTPRVNPKGLPRGFCRRRAVECALQNYFLLFIAILDLLFFTSRNSTLDYICKDLHFTLATECAFYGFTCSVYQHNET